MDSAKLIAAFLFNAFILWGLVDVVFALSKKFKTKNRRISFIVFAIVSLIALEWYVNYDYYVKLLS
jgi:hypothetical protein